MSVAFSRGRLRRLRRLAEGNVVEIPQQDGTVARFPESALRDCYINIMDRLSAGEDAPDRHPLVTAARNSSDPHWRELYADVDYEGHEDYGDSTDAVEDLSET
jgi:hypothetical protein